MYLTILIFLTKILVLLEGQAVFLLTVIHNGYFFDIFIQKPHGFYGITNNFQCNSCNKSQKGVYLHCNKSQKGVLRKD